MKTIQITSMSYLSSPLNISMNIIEYLNVYVYLPISLLIMKIDFKLLSLYDNKYSYIPGDLNYSIIFMFFYNMLITFLQL